MKLSIVSTDKIKDVNNCQEEQCQKSKIKRYDDRCEGFVSSRLHENI